MKATNDSAGMQASREAIIRWAGQGVAVVAGLTLGYDIGLRMSGGAMLMGFVLALNAALFFAVAMASALEPLLRQWRRAAERKAVRP